MIETIKKRKSIRTYSDKDFDDDDIVAIDSIIDAHKKGPFGNEVIFNMIEKEFAAEKHKVKLGTYGFISGAKYFIVAQAKPHEYIHEDCGYLLEKIILNLAAKGIGTCWLGGTFSRSDFAKVLNMDSDVLIPAITPLGFPAENRTIKEKLIRFGAKSDKRKEWKELFFDTNFGTVLTKENAGAYAEVIEMLRLAPSASNKQPWRIVKSEKAFHFYLKRTPGYQKTFINSDLQRVDMGIAMSHFELTCNELGLKGEWKQLNPDILCPDNEEYLITWKF